MAAEPSDSSSAHPADPLVPPRAGGWGRLALAGALLLAIVLFYALGGHRYVNWDSVRDNLALLEEQTHTHFVATLLIFVVVYVAVTALSLPVAAPLTLLGGALFGRWLATGAVLGAATLGATLAMLSSRYLFRASVQRRFGTRLAALNRGVEREGAYYLFTLRLVPVFPFWLINLGMGLTPIRPWTFAWASLVGMLPGTFVFANTGTALREIQSPKDVLSTEVLLAFTLLGLVPLVLKVLVNWLRHRPPT